MNLKKRFKLTSFQIILLGFVGIILVGTILLMLPISSKSRVFTPFIDAFFTSTSAVCVTGLVVYDTATYFSIFGQAVLLVLIQIGGIGVVTIASLFIILSGKKIGLSRRGTLMSALSAPSIGGIVKLTRFIIRGVLIIELIGALLMLPEFIINFGARGIWLAFFHSISAFCNAGFDIMGTEANQFQSLTGFSSSVSINVVIILLIVIGGIGFLVWKDVLDNKFRFSKYSMQSKVVISITGFLIIVPALYLFIFEFKELNFLERFLASIFQSVTTRTAGFNTIDLNNISDAGISIMTMLMLIGGSPGSTAGGMKTTTIMVIVATIVSVFNKKKNARLFNRRLDDTDIKVALTVFFMYISGFILGSILINAIEGGSFKTIAFEVASAIGTVGLSLGITPSLTIASKIILAVFMFFGRVGGLTIVYAAIGNKDPDVSKYPLERISIG
ncbi:Trk family potassium uptake protein [bacterium]|nr:Trk family potassium uptake protein [bacterium]